MYYRCRRKRTFACGKKAQIILSSAHADKGIFSIYLQVKEQTKSEASTDQDHKGSKSATDTDSTAKPERKSARADTEQPVAGDPEHTANTEKQPVAGVDPEQLASEDPDQVMSAAEMQAAITRLEAVAVRLESLAHTTGTTTTGGGGGGAAAPGKTYK